MKLIDCCYLCVFQIQPSSTGDVANEADRLLLFVSFRFSPRPLGMLPMKLIDCCYLCIFQIQPSSTGDVASKGTTSESGVEKTTELLTPGDFDKHLATSPTHKVS